MPLEFSQTEDSAILQLTLEDIHKPVIALRVGGVYEESLVNQEMNCVINDPLQHFTINELEPCPYAMDDGRSC